MNESPNYAGNKNKEKSKATTSQLSPYTLPNDKQDWLIKLIVNTCV